MRCRHRRWYYESSCTMKDRRFVEFASCRTKGALAEKRLFSVTSRGLQITHQKSDICHSQYVARNSCSNQKYPSMHGRVFIYSRVKRTSRCMWLAFARILAPGWVCDKDLSAGVSTVELVSSATKLGLHLHKKSCRCAGVQNGWVGGQGRASSPWLADPGAVDKEFVLLKC